MASISLFFITAVSGLLSIALMNAIAIRSDLAIGYEKTLVACTLFRDDAMYLDEWVRFHEAMGVEHFYLYSHGSIDNYKEVLEPFVNSNLVTLIEWPSEPNDRCKPPSEIPKEGVHKQAPCQQLAFEDCVMRAKRSRAEWIAIMDVDEFFYTPKSCYRGSLRDVLRRDVPWDVAKISVFGWSSGTQGFEHPLDGERVLERYQYRNLLNGVDKSDPVWAYNDAVKSIGRSSHVVASDIHRFVMSWSSFMAGYMYKTFMPDEPGSPIRMRHFSLRSYESIFRKVERNGYKGISYRAERDYWHSSELDLEVYNCSKSLGLFDNLTEKMEDIPMNSVGKICTIIHHSNASDTPVKVRKAFWSIYRANFSSRVVVIDSVGGSDYFIPTWGYQRGGWSNISDICGNNQQILWVPRASWEYIGMNDGTLLTMPGEIDEVPTLWRYPDDFIPANNFWFIDLPKRPFTGGKWWF